MASVATEDEEEERDVPSIGHEMVLSYLEPAGVARLACTCRGFALNERGDSVAWRESAWGRYTTFGERGELMEPRRSPTKFEWWSVEEVTGSSISVAASSRESDVDARFLRVLRGVLRRPAPLMIICLSGIQGNFTRAPFTRGGIFAEIARAKKDTLRTLNLSDTVSQLDAVNECLELVPNLRALIFNDGGGIIRNDRDGNMLQRLGPHHGLRYLRLPDAQDHVLNEVYFVLPRFPHLHVLDLTCFSGPHSPNLCPPLRSIVRDHHRHLRSIMIQVDGTSARARGPFDVNALDDLQAQIDFLGT